MSSFHPLVLITSSTFLLIMARANDFRGPALYLWARLGNKHIQEQEGQEEESKQEVQE